MINSLNEWLKIPKDNASKLLLKEALALSDEDLVRQIITTKSDLRFGVLYERYSDKVYRKCYQFVKNKDEAQDLAQDLFVKLFHKIDGYKGKSKFSTWLYAFTYNFCINYLKRDQNKKLTTLTEKLNKSEYRIADDELELDEDFHEIQLSNLEKALEMIAPEEKALLLLKYQDNISMKELQMLLNLNESALKMRLKRARIKVVKAHSNLK